jgi:hypothetical protein
MCDISFSLDLLTTKEQGGGMWLETPWNTISHIYIYTYGKTPKHIGISKYPNPTLHHYYIQNTYGKAPSKLVFYYPTPNNPSSIASHMNVP